MSKNSYRFVAAAFVLGLSSPSRADSTCDFTSRLLADNSKLTDVVLDDSKLTDVLVKESDAKKRAAALDELKQLWDARGAVLHSLTVKGPERVSVNLRNPPGSRLRLSFDAGDGAHHEVEWDPAVAGELTRVVALEGPVSPATERVWNISISVEASTYTQAAGTVIVHSRFGPFKYLAPAAAGEPNGSAIVVGTYTALAASLGGSAAPEGRDLKGWPAPVLAFSCEAPLVSMDDERFPEVGPTPQSGLRGFGVAPTFVTDTLSLLTEIAIDRAKAGAMSLLKKRLVDPFCVSNSTKITLAKLGLGTSDDIALPRTCEILTALRLEDILSSGRPLLFALRDDLRFTVAPAAVTELTKGNTTASAALGVGLNMLNTAIDHGGFDGLEGQLALGLLGSIEQLGPRIPSRAIATFRKELRKLLRDHKAEARAAVEALISTGAFKPVRLPKAAKAVVGETAQAEPICTDDDDTERSCVAMLEQYFASWLARPSGQWKLPAGALLDLVQAKLVAELQDHDATRNLLGYACQARMVVAVIKRCTKQGCSAQSITDMVSRPESYFAQDKVLPAALCWAGNKYFAPDDASTSVSQLVLEGMRLAAPLVDGRGRDRAKAAVKLLVALVERWQGEPTRKRLDTFSELAIALIDEDYGTALGRLVRLAQQMQPNVPDPLKKIAQLVGSVATYASVYQATKDSDPEEARSARKQALSSIIDNATDRSDREGETIFSIGSNVGLSATWNARYGAALDDRILDPGVRVPFAFAIDWMPGKGRCIKFLGYHVGFQVFDLGQFVRRGTDDKLDSIRWADFVSPGMELSLLLGFIDPALNVSVHAAYAPSLVFSTTSVDMMGNTVTNSTDGVWRAGISVGYYVPFIDLK